MRYEFVVIGELFEWRGPAPFHFVRMNQKTSNKIKSEAKLLSYGWGVIPIYGIVGNTPLTTSLIPKEGCYLIPIKDSVRISEEILLGQIAQVDFNLGKRVK
jgi:hypothetical protein